MSKFGNTSVELAPHVGSRQMPPWEVRELPDAPKFGPLNWFALLGPGLVMGASAIGGGEWLMGPLVTAKYGGALMWLVTVSIPAQALDDIELSRYPQDPGKEISRVSFGNCLVRCFGSRCPCCLTSAATFLCRPPTLSAR